jgi:hypothetical protein
VDSELLPDMGGIGLMIPGSWVRYPPAPHDLAIGPMPIGRSSEGRALASVVASLPAPTRTSRKRMIRACGWYRLLTSP